MAVGPLLPPSNQVLWIFLAWVIVFAQAYLAYIYLRRHAENTGISTSKALLSSLGRLGLISLITLTIVGIALVLLFRMP